MAYTYLITGATSDVGRALIERLLTDAPADTTVLAQGCGDLEKLADQLGVDISGAKNNKERAELIAAVPVQAPANETGGAQ